MASNISDDDDNDDDEEEEEEREVIMCSVQHATESVDVESLPPPSCYDVRVL